MNDQKLSFHHSRFGLQLIPEFDGGPTDTMVVCLTGPLGIQPLTLLLPHQLYGKNIQQLQQRYAGATPDGLVLIPSKTSERIEIALDAITDQYQASLKRDTE